MSIVALLLPLALLLGLAFVGGFLRMVRDGQYEDLVTPAHRMLLDDSPPLEENK